MPTRECDALVIVAANYVRETFEFGDIVVRGLIRVVGHKPVHRGRRPHAAGPVA